MRTSAILITFLLLVLPAAASAHTQGVYFNLGFGGASATYPSDLEDAIDFVEDLPGVSHAQIGIDLTLYFPVGHDGLLGPTINGIADRLSQGSNHLQINQYLYGVSYRKYTSHLVGSGFYLRADAGLARMVLDDSTLGTSSTDVGFGVLFGGGYSWQISGGTWFSLHADYTAKRIEEESVGGLTIGLDFLF